MKVKQQAPPSKPIRLVFCVGDLHCGSTYGLLPPGFITHEGNPIGQNTLQKWTWECWQRGLRWMAEVAGRDPYVLLVNGDAIDGNHHYTREIWSPDEGDHLKCARDLLAPLVARAGKTVIVEGTAVHTHNAEYALGEMLGAVPDPNTGNGAWQRADLTVGGTRIIAQHHIPTASRSWTAASALCAGLVEEQLQAAQGGEVLPLAIVTAHRHTFGVYEGKRGVAVGLPAWQGIGRFPRKVVPSARFQCGVVALDLRGLPDGSVPQVRAATYTMPQAKGVAL